MERIWIIIAGCCVIVAGILIYLGKIDGAFVIGVIGAMAWFLDLRNRLSKQARITENSSKPEGEGLGDQHED